MYFYVKQNFIIMNLRNSLLFTFLLTMSFYSIAQNPCNCVIDPNEPIICAQDSFGISYPVPNECVAICLGFTVVDFSLCDSGPWSECDCVIDPNEPEICVEFDGYTFKVPNVCIADCKGFTIVADSLCDSNPFIDCMCPIDDNEPWICTVDSLGNVCSLPNACYANCFGLTVVPCGETIDFGILTCTEDLIIDGDMLFQDLLLMLNQSCDFDLPECVLNAPLFTSDSLFIDYILSNCDLLASTGNSPSIGSIYNLYQSITSGNTSSTSDSKMTSNSSLQLNANPVSNNLVYVIESNLATNAQISLLDINGQIMFSNNIQLSNGQQKFDEDVTALKSGMYMLNLRTQNGQQTIKVVILK